MLIDVQSWCEKYIVWAVMPLNYLGLQAFQQSNLMVERMDHQREKASFAMFSRGMHQFFQYSSIFK